MHYRVYLDVLFVINFVMDFSVLSVTIRILNVFTTYSYLRRILGASAGALWAVIIIVLGLKEPVWYMVTYFGISTLMVIIVIGWKKPYIIIKGVGILYITTFALGGILHVLYYYTTLGYMLHSISNKYRASASMWPIIGVTVVAAPGVGKLIGLASAKIAMAQTLFSAVIEYGDRRVRIPALLDTGNSLTDPFNGQPVHVIEAEAVKNLMESCGQCGYHLIPYSAIGSEQGLIPVIRLDKLTLVSSKKIYVVEKPLVALYDGHFSSRAEYRMIIHPDAIRGQRLITMKKKESG